MKKDYRNGKKQRQIVLHFKLLISARNQTNLPTVFFRECQSG